MRIITKKSDLAPRLSSCVNTYLQSGLELCIKETKREILDHKVKFPLLEYCGETFYNTLKWEEHLIFCKQIQLFKTIGENVITGIILQKRLEEDLKGTFEAAIHFLEQAHIWYICDIIGERVFGYGLRHHSKSALNEIDNIAANPSKWVIRGMGAGFHYAIKKGLGEAESEKVFRVLLKEANNRDKEVRQGIGWAAKTTARFQPAVIEKYKEVIEDEKLVANWFRRKVRIGLERSNYAARD